MAREFGSTFEFSLPIFKKNNIGCFNWGHCSWKKPNAFWLVYNLRPKKEKGRR